MDYGVIDQHTNGWFLCRRPGCRQCHRCPEASTVHYECFKAFLHRSSLDYAPADLLDRLWRRAAWRMPWKQAPPLLLPEHAPVSDIALETVSSKHGIPQLPKIPAELVQMIRMRSDSALFWRLAAAIDHADSLMHTSPTKLLSVSLSDVISWRRGSKAVISQCGDACPPFVRLMIDARGLSSLERFEEDEPDFSPRRFDSIVFVMEHEKFFQDANAIFQVGLLTHHFSGLARDINILQG